MYIQYTYNLLSCYVLNLTLFILKDTPSSQRPFETHCTRPSSIALSLCLSSMISRGILTSICTSNVIVFEYVIQLLNLLLRPKVCSVISFDCCILSYIAVLGIEFQNTKWSRLKCCCLLQSRGNNAKAEGNIKQLKQELAELLEEEAKADALRRLPLYSCRITRFKFVCSKCYDNVYMLLQRP